MKKILLSVFLAVSSAWANPVAITVPHPPGGAPDVWTRIVARHLAQELNTDFVVVNRPAADGRVAIDFVEQQPADGRNLIVVSTGPFLFNKVLYKNLNLDYRNFDVMVPLAQVPLVLAVSNNLGVTSLREFVELSRTRVLNCAGSSASSVFVGKHMMKQIQAKEVQFIPFKGSADMNVQLAAGNIDCAFDTTLATLPLHQGGKIKIIATSTNAQILPDTATLRSVVPGLVFYNWYGIGMRLNTANSDQIFRALKRINQNSEYQTAVKKAGLEIVEPADNGSQWLQQEYQKYETMRQQLKIDKID